MIWRRARKRADESTSECDLLDSLHTGSEEAMGELYRRHGGLVYRFSLRLVQDESLAEEITQEVFLALLNQAHDFDSERASLSTWLCGIARRQAWKQLRAQHRHAAMPSGEELENIESLDEDPSEILTRREATQAVERGIETLPVELREVIVLCELEEMKYEDAAKVLGIPVGTVRSRLHRAKHRLAALLKVGLVQKREEGQ
ncbi:RNA polymerase sigma factor [Paludibaculum fermentans]|uniref:Sigma-70 family RNA polymerase sigma factor n=1 Tax=Paludibaculum fermentans TaxID=1473598 RepID=A0A7S7NPJ0_PALFE|nr:sigma-70 family RNA polymerase sigma factor [Paludibaculum fermentans]QOY86909.1 sigma-70 family RNA polymerase sigma factor [Paludibaculum fermentans]